MENLAEPRRRSGWYHGWNIVAAAMMSHMAASGFGVICMPLFLPSWTADLGSPPSELLLAVIPLVVISGIVSPPIGMLADKYHPRWLFGVGLGGTALCYLAVSFVDATWQIWAIYVLFPIFASLCGTVPANALVARWFVWRAGLALGITTFGVGIAALVLSPLVAELIPLGDWRNIWRGAAAVVAFVLLPGVLIIMRHRPGENDDPRYVAEAQGASTRSSLALGHSAQPRTEAHGLTWGEILKRPNFWILAAFFLPMLVLFLSVQQNMAPLTTSHGLDPRMAGTLIAVLGLARMASSLFMGILSDRYGSRRPLVLLALVSALGPLALGLGEGATVMIVGAALCGFSGGVWALLPAAIAKEFGSQGVGKVFGGLILFVPLSSIFPALIARVKEDTGSYAPAMLVLTAACVVSTLVALGFRERPFRSGEPAEGAPI